MWFQTRFGGSSIQTENGTLHHNLFNELAVRVKDIFGADGCNLYRYRPGEDVSTPAHRYDDGHCAGYLERIGSGFGYKYFDDYSNTEAQHIAYIGTNTKERSKSLCYQVIENGESAFKGNATRSDLSISSRSLPRTVLVAPLLYRGRVWGVVELLGRNSSQFPYAMRRWVDEIARVLTPILHDQWMFFRFREISRSAIRDAPTSEKYIQVLDHVRRLFLATSGRLYLQHTKSTADFEMKCHTGMPWPDGYANSFNLDDRSSVSANAIYDVDCIWRHGVLGQGEFIEVESKEQTIGPLQRAGHHSCIVVPIRDSRGNCFASLILTSIDPQEYKGIWDSIIGTITGQLSVVLEAIHLQDKQIEDRNEYLAHTIKTRVDRLDESSRNLLLWLTPLVGDKDAVEHVIRFVAEVEAIAGLPAVRSNPLSEQSRDVLTRLRRTFPDARFPGGRHTANFPVVVSEFQANLREVRLSAVRIAGGINEEDPGEADPDTWCGTWADIRGTLLGSIKPRAGNPHHNRNLREPEGAILPWGYKFRIPEQILLEIFNNIVDNAIKYDFSPPSIRFLVKTNVTQHWLSIDISNMAPRLSRVDADKIKLGGERGGYAAIKNRDGTAVGLRYCFHQARRWGLSIVYEVPILRPLEVRFGLHTIRLKFEGRRLRTPGDGNSNRQV